MDFHGNTIRHSWKLLQDISEDSLRSSWDFFWSFLLILPGLPLKVFKNSSENFSESPSGVFQEFLQEFLKIPPGIPWKFMQRFRIIFSMIFSRCSTGIHGFSGNIFKGYLRIHQEYIQMFFMNIFRTFPKNPPWVSRKCLLEFLDYSEIPPAISQESLREFFGSSLRKT